MRKKIATAVAIGALGLGGLAVSASALAADGDTDGTATSRVQAIKDALAGLVGDGSLTQDQADEVATTLGSADLGGGDRKGGGGPKGGGHERFGGTDLATAATTLKLSEDDLRTALQGGKTLAAVAGDQGVAVDDLIAALVDAQEAKIAQAVTDGDLTQAQADDRLADLTQRITDRVNATVPAGGRGGGRGADRDGSTPAPTDSPSASPSSASPSATATSGT